MKAFHIAVVSALGAGFAKFAPGTWGTLVGSIILWMLWIGGILSTPLVLLALTIGVTVLGYWSITQLPDTWIHDDQRIVIDEVLGLWVTMLWVPINWKTILLSFILFRL